MENHRPTSVTASLNQNTCLTELNESWKKETLTEGLTTYKSTHLNAKRKFTITFQYLGAWYSETVLHDHCREQSSVAQISRQPVKWGPLVSTEQRCNQTHRIMTKGISRRGNKQLESAAQTISVFGCWVSGFDMCLLQQVAACTTGGNTFCWVIRF